jgi:hypothetical protein
MLRRKVSVTLRLLTASVVILATPAFAAPVHASASVTAPVTGVFTAPGGSGPVGGAYTLSGFANQEGELVGVGTLTYSLCIPNVDPKNCLATLSQELALPVTAVSVSASCGELQISLAPTTLVSPPTLPDFTIALNAISFDIASNAHPTQNLLCALASRVEASGVSGQLAPMLTQLIRLLGDP